jgi:hypothetical protein
MPSMTPSLPPSVTASAEPSTMPSAQPSECPSYVSVVPKYLSSFSFDCHPNKISWYILTNISTNLTSLVGRGSCLDGINTIATIKSSTTFLKSVDLYIKRDAFRRIVISHNYYCNCLYDDGFLPNPAPGQSSTSHSGSGEIVTSDGSTDAWCYRYIADDGERWCPEC